MKYCSTRGQATVNQSYTAITKGLADDGGLFVCDFIPYVDINQLCSTELTYTQMAKIILGKYLGDYGDDILDMCIDHAYDDGFDDELVAPVRRLDDDNYILELWHGPTAAFKDMALQLLPHLMVNGKKLLDDNRETIILVATSGDTGKAALEGFRDVDGTKVIVYYPRDGVADLQEIQMATQAGDNVYVVSVDGNFDDTQTGVKSIFSDRAIAAMLANHGAAFSSANSINFGRLCPQIVYYFYAYYQMVASGDITVGEQIDFVVPTGNFGNILAGYYAMSMGLPVGRLICASNDNNILTDFINTGQYNTNREFYRTSSPSMDILISSNLERLLYEASGRDADVIVDLMSSLHEHGSYEANSDIMQKINQAFVGVCADESETLATIRTVYDKYNYLLDTHTAVAFACSEKIPTTAKRVIISTANPYKFPDSVLGALGHEVSDNSFENIEILQQVTGTTAPSSLSGLQEKKIRHENNVSIEDMPSAIDLALR